MNRDHAPTLNQQLEHRPNQEDENSEQKERKKLQNVTVSTDFNVNGYENLVEDQQPQVAVAAEAKVPTPPMTRNTLMVVAS